MYATEILPALELVVTPSRFTTFELAALRYRERLKLGVRLKRTGFVQNGFNSSVTE